MSPAIDVAVDDRQADHDVDTARWRELAAAALVAEGVEPPAEMSLVFVDGDTIRDLNETHLGGTGPTDVLAFPIDLDEHDRTGPVRMVGDVVVCPAVAASGAASRGAPLDDEIALLIVHGVLHLLGHDHAEPDEAATMRSHERDLLSRFHRS